MKFRISAKYLRNLMRVTVAIAILTLGNESSKLASIFIHEYFPNRPLPLDLIISATPHYVALEYFTDVLLFSIAGIALFTALFLYWKDIPKRFSVLGIGFMLRGLIVRLTPLHRPSGLAVIHGIFPLLYGTELEFMLHDQVGMYVSGHMMSSYIAYASVDATKAPKVKKLLFTLVVIEAIAMIVSRGHYAIDILGGLTTAVLLIRLFNSWGWYNRVMTMEEGDY